MTILTIDQQIEAVEKIIRAGDKTDGSAGLMDELFGETNESRVEEAMHADPLHDDEDAAVGRLVLV